MARTTRLAIAAVMWACAAAGHAGLITASGGVSHTTAGNNDILGAGEEGSIGGSLSVSKPSSVTYTFLGKEAGWNNVFEAHGDTLSGMFVNASSTMGQSFTVVQSTGLLDFLFTTPHKGNVSNGSNSLGAPHFFLQVVGNSSAIIALDDGGAGPDADYDDLVVRVDAVAVPEPATAALMAAGLACLGMIRRRKLRAETATI